MLTVHHLRLSQSERIVWLCEELEIPYRLKLYERDPETRGAPAAYKALHPMGIAPVITDGDLVLGESGAIIDYIIAKHGDGRLAITPDDPGFADYLYWFHFANGTLMPSEMGMMLASGSEIPLAGFIQDRVSRAYAFLDQRLGQTPYLAGANLTAADIISVFPLTTMRVFTGRSLNSYANIRAYLAKIGQRPAYRRAMTKADPGHAPLLT